MKRERMLEFVRELGFDPSSTLEVRLDPDGWLVEQFRLDDDGERVLSEDYSGYLRTGPVTGEWE